MNSIFKTATILAIGLLWLTSCKNQNSNKTKEQPKEQTKEIATKILSYTSNDATQKFELHILKDNVSLKDITNNKVYKMTSVNSASGSKYESEDGYVFWLKRDEYSFFKNDERISKGKFNSPTSKKTRTYVSDSYEKRNEGYDWTSVNVSEESLDKLNISVRSRADKKKPTCTLNITAYKADKNTYKAFENNMTIVFSFNDTSVAIHAEKEENNALLSFYCSGGASLEGSYKLITGNADPSQIDKTQFTKVLTWQDDTRFDILSEKKGNKHQVTITPFGLTKDTAPVTHNIDGIVANAEIGDLNADGFPELLLYIQSTNSGNHGSVIGYSVNNGKSMSEIYIAPITENKEVNKGYLGHDDFAIMETTFVQRFPLYKTDDTNSSSTGTIRQIQYKLKDGEASRKLVIDKVIEY